ncbi:hypothetical protein CK203_049803 [Vitis vinifera]|uniref:Uncharacterized protein n=1 Tax=Vitis vinifera TaxID=29760 RepID=A0A438H257_VITVI|nr:hypothetical protein CK203_049803 [Vitis vinifera]
MQPGSQEDPAAVLCLNYSGEHALEAWLKRLKLGNGLQYVLNAKGSSPAEVLGIDYKSTLKPALDSFADDINKSSMSKLEELISFQQQSVENAAKIEAKKIILLHFNPVVMK